MPLPFDERVDTAAHLIKRAKIFYDVWWLYEGVDTRSKYLPAMNRYSEFFRFDSHAHFVALIVHLAALFESRSDTINFAQLIDEAASSSLVPLGAVSEARAGLDVVSALPPKLAILRSNLFAHRSAELSYAEAFAKAEITSDQIRDLAVEGLRIVNIILAARGLPIQHFHDLSLEHAERLLTKIAPTNAA